MNIYFRALTQLLTDLNLFVLSMDLMMTKQDVLSLSTPDPDRERQKLIREQNILKKVRNMSVFSHYFSSSALHNTITKLTVHLLN